MAKPKSRYYVARPGNTQKGVKLLHPPCKTLEEARGLRRLADKPNAIYLVTWGLPLQWIEGDDLKKQA